MTQTASTETVFAESIPDVTIAIRTTPLAQTDGLVTPSIREVRIVGALTSAFSTFRLWCKCKLTLDVFLAWIADASSHS